MRKLWVAESFPMFFGRSGYGYRSYSFSNPLCLLPSLERDYKYILLYIYNLYIYYLQSVSPQKALYPLQENCNFCNRNHCNHLHCLLILSCEVQGIITFSQLLSENSCRYENKVVTLRKSWFKDRLGIMVETNDRRLPVGIQSFEIIRKDGYLYVDKTDIIWQLANKGKMYNYLSRPRRFGKSVLVDTLEAYFMGKK